MIDEKPQIFSKENKKTTDKNGKQKGDLKNPPGDLVDILFVVGGIGLRELRDQQHGERG